MEAFVEMYIYNLIYVIIRPLLAAKPGHYEYRIVYRISATS